MLLHKLFNVLLAALKTDLAVARLLDFRTFKEEIVLTWIPKSLKTQLYKGIRDSFASE
jgi:F-type H+-transporting ATPase subunit gamma